MNSPISSSDSYRNKAPKWIANHLGTFSQKSSVKDAVNNAFLQLSNQLSDGRFRELQCIIEVNRDTGILYVKRWLDNVILEEFNLPSISNVISYTQVPQNTALTNIITFNTRSKEPNVIETHIFHLDDITTTNYLASDIRSAVEACSIKSAHNTPVKVLPSSNRDSVKFSNFDSSREFEDITSKTERNLLLLNYCFDDIEFFLQHLSDQENARASIASNKNKAPVDRLLEGRAKPSTPTAYIACIQKFKFSFNLLSKLDGKIKDPSSQQLSEVLMENLLKIARAYGLFHNGKLSKIKEPLLTVDTVKMMQAYLSKNHFKSWNSWGEFWIKPRERWTGYQEKYYPEFFNGYQIDIEDLVKDGVISPSTAQPKVNRHNSEINQLIHSNQSSNVVIPNVDSGKGPSNQREEDFCRSVCLRSGKLYRVLDSFTASKDQELSMSKDEIIEVVEARTDRNWWLCANMHGQKGYCPSTFLQPFNYVDRTIQTVTVPPAPPTPTQKPMNTSWTPKRESVTSSSKETVNFEKSLEEAKTINEEIKKKILTTSTFGNPLTRASFARPGPVVSKKHGQLSINQESTEIDVRKWLRFKKFSEEDIEKLKEFTGQTIFLLTRDQMNRIIGVDSAARLDSVIKVQKSLCGFGTLSRKELDDILLIRKNQVEFQQSY